jgi:glutathione synthase/RimK-type ligase-like ATP-grasp enzyme
MAYIIIGQREDEHAIYMLEKMNGMGLSTYLLETYDFPRKIQFSFSPNNGSGALKLQCGTTLELDSIKAVYWRNFTGVTDEVTRESLASGDYLAARDSMACLRTWFHLNNTTKWLNSWDAFEDHQEKPHQLMKVSRKGVRIPETYVGNNLNDIKSIYNSLDKSIFKPVYGGAHTEILTPAHFESERVEKALSKSPITVQQFIEGTNVRTYVIGENIYSIELKSELADFREDLNLELIEIETPIHIVEQSKLIMDILFLKWTAIDWRRDKDGNYFFLEANPSPMFIDIEKHSSFTISDDLIELMTKN